MKRYSAHALVTESPLVDEFAFVENESGRYYRMDDVQKAMAAKDAKIELLSDALDGIAKVASMARTITKRVDWIIARAKTALQGDAWDKSYKPMPNNNVQRVERLRFQIDELNEQLRVARALVAALDNAFISSWQSTASWSKELEAAKLSLGTHNEQRK